MQRIKPIITLYPHQHDYVMSKHLHPAIIAGYGSGKTYANIQRILHLLEIRKGHAFIFYAAPTYDLINSSFLPDFLETLELYGIRYKANRQEHTITITEPTLKGIIKYISLDNYKNLVAFNATDGILDEFDILTYERQKAVWVRALARLRACEDATLSITSTPEGFKLCYELYTAGKIRQIQASTRDNKSLPQSFIDEMMDNYDAPHQAMYIEGNYVNLNGLRAIYAFDRSRVIPAVWPDEIPHDLTVGMDFNVDPFCMTISYMTKDGIKITFDEFFIRNLGNSSPYASYTDKALNMLLTKYPNRYYNLNMIKGDKHFNIKVRPDMTGNARDTTGNLSDLAILKQYELPYEGQHHLPVPTRLMVANTAMNTGKWLITENCKELIKDLDQVVTDSHGEIQKGDDMRTHLLDAVTYDVYMEFKHLVFKPQRARVL